MGDRPLAPTSWRKSELLPERLALSERRVV
jgi:hypothetical protein